MSNNQIEADYERAKAMYAGYQPFGNERIEFVTKAEYIARRTKCANCPDKNTCSVRGCSRWKQVIHRDWKCPREK